MRQQIMKVSNIKLTGFSSGDKLFAFIRGFSGLKGLPNFFTQQMSLFFRYSIRQGSALVYIYDNLLMSNFKPHMLQFIKQFHDIGNEKNLLLVTEKFLFMVLTRKKLNHEVSFITIELIQFKNAAIHKIPFATPKLELMRFIGSLNFHPENIQKTRVNMKLL